jgi:hypothetical protein
MRQTPWQELQLERPTCQHPPLARVGSVTQGSRFGEQFLAGIVGMTSDGNQLLDN